MRVVKLLASARDDIRREKAYYRKVSPALARQFQEAVESAVNAAAEQPLAMQDRESGIRRWPLDSHTESYTRKSRTLSLY